MPRKDTKIKESDIHETFIWENDSSAKTKHVKRRMKKKTFEKGSIRASFNKYKIYYGLGVG